jgi:threonine/homoserine/homoserine lactone efflux protein
MPVEPATLGAFLLTVAALILSPGPDTVLILRYTMSSGQRVGLAAVAGVQLGLMVHTTLAVLGISLIIARTPVLFQGVAVLGALYLAWLGLQGFRGGVLRLGDGGGAPVSAAKALRDAVLTNVLNPKVIILFLALFPNFVDAGRGDLPAQLVTLGAALIVANTLWQAPLAWMADAARRWIGRPAVQRAVSRATGAVLLVFAAMMLYEHVIG